MADIIVHFVSDNLVRELLQEVKLQGTRGLHGKIQFINNELQMIKHYIKEAEPKVEREDASPELKNWVKEVKEVACKIEDVIDDYMFQVAKQRRRRRIFRLLMEFVFAAKTAKSRNIASNIGKLRLELRGLARSGSGFDFGLSHTKDGSTDDRTKPGGSSKARHIQLAGPYSIDEARDVSNDPPSETLINWLLEDTSNRMVISVVGEAKMGKTALVRKVYEKVQSEFAIPLWIQVSPGSSVEDLLKSKLKDLFLCQENKSDAEENENLELRFLVSEVLQEKRYLIVFDNVQEVDFGYLLESALPKNQNASRVLITTEKMDLVVYCKKYAAVRVYELFKPLKLKESLRLFHQRVFQHERITSRLLIIGKLQNRELWKWSYRIVEKCQRAPQAIAAIGDLLSTKTKTVSEWKKVHDNLGLILKDDPRLTSLNYYALQQGYHDLPHYLKQCLLYFGLFPMGYPIRRTRLVRLWVAEGFVEKKHGQKYDMLEEDAKKYLEDLEYRKLVYIDDKNNCRIQDQMHEFIVKKCDELNFCQVLKNNTDGCNPKTGFRRLSIQEDNNNNDNDDDNNNNEDDDGANENAAANRVRSLFIFDKKDRSSLLTRFFSDFKFLKVLDFEDATDLSDLPDAVGNLLLLKQLSIRNTKISILPKSIGKLRSLQILDLRNSRVTELPVEVNKLVNLLYLQVYSSSENSVPGAKMKKGIARLKTLEKLYFVDLSSQGDQIIKELEKLKQLKKLGITGLTKRRGSALCGAIGFMTNLVSLSIQAAGEQQLNLEDLHPPPLQLQRLHLEGGLERLPVWITKLKNLVRIRLKFSSLKENPLIALKDLPKLVEIYLHRAYEGNQLHFKADGLRTLKILSLENLQHLKTLKVDREALCCLETLCIGSCRELQFPDDIKNMKNLGTLHFVDMPEELVQSLDKENGKHYPIIERVKEVVICNTGKKPRGVVTSVNQMRGDGLSDDTSWMGNIFGDDFEKMLYPNEASDDESSSKMRDSTADKNIPDKPKESSERQSKERKSSERDSHEDASSSPRSKRESNCNTMISKDEVGIQKSTQDPCEEQEETNSSDLQPTKVDETSNRQPNTTNGEALHTSEPEAVHFGTNDICIPNKGQVSSEPTQENVDSMADNSVPPGRVLCHISTLESQNSYEQLEKEYKNAKAQLDDTDDIPNGREDLSDRPGMDFTCSMADEQKSVTIPGSLLHASTLDSQNSFEKTTSSGKRNVNVQSWKPKKRYQQIQKANCALLNAWIEASKVFLEASNARSEMGKGKSVEATDSDFSPSKCVATLDEVEDVSDDVYIKALEKFIVPEWREIFLSMPPQRRKAWLDELG